MDQMNALFGFEKREQFIVQADQNADDESEHHEKLPTQHTKVV